MNGINVWFMVVRVRLELELNKIMINIPEIGVKSCYNVKGYLDHFLLSSWF